MAVGQLPSHLSSLLPTRPDHAAPGATRPSTIPSPNSSNNHNIPTRQTSGKLSPRHSRSGHASRRTTRKPAALVARRLLRSHFQLLHPCLGRSLVPPEVGPPPRQGANRTANAPPMTLALNRKREPDDSPPDTTTRTSSRRETSATAIEGHMSKACAALLDEPPASYSESVATEMRERNPPPGEDDVARQTPPSDDSRRPHPSTIVSWIASASKANLHRISWDSGPRTAVRPLSTPSDDGVIATASTKDDATDRGVGERVQPHRQVLLSARGQTRRIGETLWTHGG